MSPFKSIFRLVFFFHICSSRLLVQFWDLLRLGPSEAWRWPNPLGSRGIEKAHRLLCRTRWGLCRRQERQFLTGGQAGKNSIKTGTSHGRKTDLKADKQRLSWKRHEKDHSRILRRYEKNEVNATCVRRQQVAKIFHSGMERMLVVYLRSLGSAMEDVSRQHVSEVHDRVISGSLLSWPNFKSLQNERLGRVQNDLRCV